MPLTLYFYSPRIRTNTRSTRLFLECLLQLQFWLWLVLLLLCSKSTPTSFQMWLRYELLRVPTFHYMITIVRYCSSRQIHIIHLLSYSPLASMGNLEMPCIHPSFCLSVHLSAQLYLDNCLIDLIEHLHSNSVYIPGDARLIKCLTKSDIPDL